MVTNWVFLILATLAWIALERHDSRRINIQYTQPLSINCLPATNQHTSEMLFQWNFMQCFNCSTPTPSGNIHSYMTGTWWDKRVAESIRHCQQFYHVSSRESTSMVWPTLGSRMAKEQNSIPQFTGDHTKDKVKLPHSLQCCYPLQIHVYILTVLPVGLHYKLHCKMLIAETSLV